MSQFERGFMPLYHASDYNRQLRSIMTLHGSQVKSRPRLFPSPKAFGSPHQILRNPRGGNSTHAPVSIARFPSCRIATSLRPFVICTTLVPSMIHGRARLQNAWR